MNKDFSEIYEKYSNEVYRYLLVLTHDTYLSEEITQETFRRLSSFKGECSIYTWVCAIAKNCLKKYYSKNSKYVYELEIASVYLILTLTNSRNSLQLKRII